MAQDPLNQQAFAEDVAAAAAAGGDQGFAMPPGGGGGGPGSPDFKMPSADEIWKMVESMDGISDDERAELRESIFNPKPTSPEDLLRQYAHPGHSSREYMIFFVMIALVLLVFGKQSSDNSKTYKLKRSVEAIVAKTGPHSKFAEDLLQKIGNLQTKMESLNESDRHKFISEMKGSFQEAIARIERRLLTHSNLANTYATSILVAVIFLIVSVFALFGFKLYKSLTEKELKKQEKLKSKQQKKSKKSN
ncbi:hypothetical protein ACLKA7_000577 [Drosophila subpalustris]